jgi:hypothetical protein
MVPEEVTTEVEVEVEDPRKKKKKLASMKKVEVVKPKIAGEMFGKYYTKEQMDNMNENQNKMLISGSSDYKNGKRISPMKDRINTMKKYNLKN